MEHLVRKCKLCGTQYPSDFSMLCEVDFEDTWIFWCQKHGKSAGPLGCEDCAYKFSGKAIFDQRELAECLFVDWNRAKQDTARRSISNWLADTGRDRLLCGTLKEVERMDSLSADDRLALTLMLLYGDGIVRWKGKVLQFSSLQDEQELALQLLSGPLPTILADFGICSWLYDIKQHWNCMLSAVAAEPGNEAHAFRLLFSPESARNLSTALTLAALVPRFKLPSSWPRQVGPIEKMSKSVSDTGFVFPANADLKARFRSICCGLKAGNLRLGTNSEYYESIFLLSWKYEGKPLLENPFFRGMLSGHLNNNPDRKLLRSLVFVYFQDFDLRIPVYVSFLAELIRSYLHASDSSEFRKWRSLNDRVGLFAGTEAPGICAKELNLNSGVESGLSNIGMPGSNLWGGLSAEILLALMKAARDYDVDFWEHIRIWFEKCASFFSDREYQFIDAIASANADAAVGKDFSKAVSRYLVDRYGEPDQSTPVWKQCLDSTRELINQWLLFENLEKFFDVIADYAETTGGEMRSQWSYRRAFWLAVYRTGAVTDLRVAVGKGLLQAMGESRLKDRFGSKLVRLNDSDERRCALVLKLGPLTIVDFTHNAKCRIWESGLEQVQWFKVTKFTRFTLQGGTDLKIRPHYETTGITHFRSEAYGWQDVLADFLRSYLPVKLPNSSYRLPY